MKISYNWLQSYFDEKLPKPPELVELITFHAFEIESIDEVLDDVILDVKVLPDRAHDCLSHRGIAREVSAILDIPMLMPKYLPYSETKGSTLAINIESPHCRRYAAKIVRDIKMAETPLWIRDRLEAVGQKSINIAVDIANYALFEIGQPIHVFDADKIKDHHLRIMAPQSGQKIVTLDGKEVELRDSDLVIADGDGNPLALAGIKGGKLAEVDASTKNLIIEVANFDPVTVRKTSRRLGILSDAAKRFENDLTPYVVTEAMENVTALVAEFLEGEPETMMDVYPSPVSLLEIDVTRAYINGRLGAAYTDKHIESIWKRLQFPYTREKDLFTIAVPYERRDIVGPHDLSEEVGRIMGYEHLKASIPHLKIPKEIDQTFYTMLAVRKKLLEDGYSEVMTYAFAGSGEVAVLASASDKKFLRSNLTDGLKDSYQKNSITAPLLELDPKEIKIFEIGTVFKGDSEEIHVAWADKNNVTEMTLDEYTEKNHELNSKHDSYDSLLSTSDFQLSTKRFVSWSLYPFIKRDIALWVPKEVENQRVMPIIREHAGPLLVAGPSLFDSFTKEEKTSLAYRLIFQADNRTLTDLEINTTMTNIQKELEKQGFSVR